MAEVPDPRRAEGKLYQLPHLLLFSILANVTGCNSYRGIVTFIEVHRRKLTTIFGLKWRESMQNRGGTDDVGLCCSLAAGSG